jgi:hypothetical protein
MYASWRGNCCALDLQHVALCDSSGKESAKASCGPIVQMYASEGIRGFWRGFGPCLVRSFPANAVCFMVYEQTKKVLDNLTGES